MLNARMSPNPGLRRMHFEPEPEVLSVSRWLAHQRAVNRELMDTTAYQLVAAKDVPPPVADGPDAAVVAQPRGALWVVGRLGGPPVLCVVKDEEEAQARALNLGSALGVEAIVIDQGGDVAVRKPGARAPTLKVGHHEGQWAVFVEGRVVATAPTRERARNKARLLKVNTDFLNKPRPPE